MKFVLRKLTRQGGLHILLTNFEQFIKIDSISDTVTKFDIE